MLGLERTGRDCSDYTYDSGRFLRHGGNLVFPKIGPFQLSTQYAANGPAGKETPLRLFSSLCNIDNEFPQPQGYEVDWYGIITPENNCSQLTFAAGSLSGTARSKKLQRAQSYTYFLFDNYGNLLYQTSMGSPERDGYLGYASPFENGFRDYYCSLLVEVGHAI